jgi:hypothetical protein
MSGFPPHDSFVVYEPCEGYAVSTGIDECGPTEKPGVADWRRIVTSIYGGNSKDGIVRACSVGGPSDHHAGRAWDWMRDASDDVDAAAAEEVLAWLLATDATENEHAMFRRLGLTYVIWNGHVWSSRTRSWQPYTGTSPHTDHVHFSFGGPGAMGETSFFRWAHDGDYLASASPAGPSAGRLVVAGMALAGGAAAGYYAWRAMAKSSRTGFGRERSARS